jgi:stage III sporulation protein AB
MIFKIVGILFVLSSTAIAGFYYGNVETYRIYDLLEFKRALGILKSEVEFAMTPLPEAFYNISLRVKDPINKIFDKLQNVLEKEENNSIAEIWRESITEYATRTYFSKEDLDEIIVFGKTLGYLDKGMQLHSIEFLTGYIDEKIVALNKTRFLNKKMYRSLGILGGVLIIIVCI